MNQSIKLLLCLFVLLFQPLFVLEALDIQVVEETEGARNRDVTMMIGFNPDTEVLDLKVEFKREDGFELKKFPSKKKMDEFIRRLPQKGAVLVTIDKTRIPEADIQNSLKPVSKYFSDAGFKKLVIRRASGGGTIAVDRSEGVKITGAVSRAQENIDWIKVTGKAAWQARDSQGELVYKDRLWIFGGWFNSYKPCPRDVWSSGDGKNWNLVQKTAPWKHSDLSMSVVFKDKMWFMGGWYNGRLPDHSSSNQVWSSTDGEKWDQVTKSAEWTPRVAAGLVNFKGKMWILGGIENYYFGDNKSTKNDVWSSSDGKEWKLVTKNAEWSPRAYHQAVVHDGKMWVLGGGNYVPEYHANNDVWSSEDGVHWMQVTSAAPWGSRMWFSSVVYRDRIFVLGGWQKEQDNWGDVWYSKDGKNWKELKSKVIWKSRHEHSVFVFQDKIWVAGGHARPLSNEVWSLHVPKDYFKKE